MQSDGISEQEWGDLCDGCGLCCTISPARKYACPALNCETNKCSAYKTRLDEYVCVKVTPNNVGLLHRIGTLPDSCGYVRYMDGKPPLENPPTASLIPYEKSPRTEKIMYGQMHRRWFTDKIVRKKFD